ncbi:hypothetical protein [Streptomyces xiamenensis]|uniref:hypothetical protein n=1 Tax=Streptomyces xiamenensis TaxID=408015 RepID=UPI0035DC5E9E
MTSTNSSPCNHRDYDLSDLDPTKIPLVICIDCAVREERSEQTARARQRAATARKGTCPACFQPRVLFAFTLQPRPWHAADDALPTVHLCARDWERTTLAEARTFKTRAFFDISELISRAAVIAAGDSGTYPFGLSPDRSSTPRAQASSGAIPGDVPLFSLS